ncbi:MAG TPA: hypothetical protein PKH79_01875 [Prolixibacteraceae bacterium]|mgnify:CR=1 FL=1|nr:hypothetical protein [Prolixibacteraceae bacterium]
MKQANLKPILIVVSLMLITRLGFGFSSQQPANNSEQKEAYVDVVNSANGFVAITNSGQIDWISDQGEIVQTKMTGGEAFHCMLNREQQIVVAGELGSLFYFENATTFKKVNGGTNTPINCLTLFKNKIIAGHNSGELSVENEDGSFGVIPLDLKGDIVSLSSQPDECYGVTNQGEIIHTNDGIEWSIFDFNKVYAGFYTSCTFVKVEATPYQIAIVGKNVDGFPVLYFSSKGNVWSDRALNYTDDNGFYDRLKDIPSDIGYDATNDQFILTCANGRLMTIPSCSHCQKIYQITDENLLALAGNKSKLIVVGTNHFFKIINWNAL